MNHTLKEATVDGRLGVQRPAPKHSRKNWRSREAAPRMHYV